MKKIKYAWLVYLLPQLALLPLVYIGTTGEKSGIPLEFWISPIMLYVLYVCFSNIHRSTTKEAFGKVKRNTYSGFITYTILTIYVGMKLFKNPMFMEQTLFVVLYIAIQVIQYGCIIWNIYQTNKKF